MASRTNNFFYSKDLPSHTVSWHLATNVRCMSGGGVMVSGWSGWWMPTGGIATNVSGKLKLNLPRAPAHRADHDFHIAAQLGDQFHQLGFADAAKLPTGNA